MNPSLLAAVSALVAASWWLLSRRRPNLAASIDVQAIAALNRAQIALVAGSAAETTAAAGPAVDGAGHWTAAAAALPLPTTARQSAELRQYLWQQLAGPAPQRLAAMQLAARWGNRAVLPLLQRGLRDVDPGVVRAAAAAMERFRGRSSAAVPDQAPLPLPRNVSRTR